MEIHNRGSLVGRLTNAIPDMWYLEGQFTPAETEEGTAFAGRASKLDLRNAMDDPKQAIRVVLREPNGETDTLFLVMGLTGNRLFGRRVFQAEAQQWAVANVPE